MPIDWNLTVKDEKKILFSLLFLMCYSRIYVVCNYYVPVAKMDVQYRWSALRWEEKVGIKGKRNLNHNSPTTFNGLQCEVCNLRNFYWFFLWVFSFVFFCLSEILIRVSAIVWCNVNICVLKRKEKRTPHELLSRS